MWAKTSDSGDDKRRNNTIGENTTNKIPRLSEQSNKGCELGEVITTEKNVPASQELTQSYLSQHSTKAATLGKTQSRLNSLQRPPNTYFELVLMKSGVLLDEGENFILACDHVAFVSKMRSQLDRNQNFKDNFEMFKNGLRDAWSKYAIKLLTRCTISIPGEENVYQSQNSMIVNFFMIDRLRDHVLELLLDKIEKVACEYVPTILLVREQTNTPLLPLMLAQLQYVSLTNSDLIYDRIANVFLESNEQSKWDIIANAELVLAPQKHDDFAQLLLDNIETFEDLFSNLTVQTLTNLNLSFCTQGKIRTTIFYTAKYEQFPKMTLPLLIKLLLKVLTEDNEESMKELVNTLREILNWNDDTDTTLAKDTQLQFELFGYVEQGLIRSRKFYTIWQKTIASLTPSQFKPIDFIIILLLIHIKDENSFHIDNMLRRHVSHLSTSIVKKIRYKYAPMLEHHWNIVWEIINGFLCEKHKYFVDFARKSCGTLFEISESVQKLVIRKLLGLACEKSNQNKKNVALYMLRDLWQLYPKILHNCRMLLLPLLDHIHEMSLSQTRIVMELLSSIAYPVPTLDECTTLQDQIDMVIKKQIISCDIFVKKQGIISAVQLIDCIARFDDYCIEAEHFVSEYDLYDTLSDLPDGRCKIAANYMMRIQSSAMNSPECLALFFDELANICSSYGDDRANMGFLLDHNFLIWLCELMTSYFVDNFVPDNQPQMIEGVPLSYMKNINLRMRSNTEELGINIAELVLRPSNETISSILVLAPLLNLVRVLQIHRYEGTLEFIDSLLGCAILLPKCFESPNINEIFSDYDESVQKKLLDIYFHYVNWMREIVSSFATQSAPILERNRLLHRLAEVINIENKIRQLLLKAPRDYIPPQCNFIKQSPKVMVNSISAGSQGCPTSVRISVAGDIKGNKAKVVNTQFDSQIMNLDKISINDATTRNVTTKLAGANNAKSCAKRNFEIFYGPKEIYRQMDTTIISILKIELILKYPLPEEYIGYKMGLLEFRFILTDIVSKLESVVGLHKSEQSVQYIANPVSFMYDVSSKISILRTKMKMISQAINAKLEEVHHIYSHSDLFTDEFNLLKVCFSYCLRLLVAFYSWSEWFVGEDRIKKLKDTLIYLLSDGTNYQTLNQKDIGALAVDVFEVMMAYKTSVVDLKSSLHLYQLVSTLNILSDKDFKQKQSQEIRSLCRTLICRKWYNYEGLLEKGGQCNVYLDELVKGFLHDSDFKRQHDILQVVREESKLLSDKDRLLKSYPNFKKANFPLFFRGLCDILITSLHDKIIRNLLERSMDRLEFWESSCKLLNTLLEILQALDLPRNFQIFLKYSHLYFKLVLQHGLPVFEQYFGENTERVCELIKTMQTIIRYLHHLCCQSEAINNVEIVCQIPFLRETLEIYSCRIKTLLTANNCASVFIMFNLKNKDLHGHDLASQSVSSLTTETNADSDEEIPDDDLSFEESFTGYTEI